METVLADDTLGLSSLRDRVVDTVACTTHNYLQAYRNTLILTPSITLSAERLDFRLTDPKRFFFFTSSLPLLITSDIVDAAA